MIGTPDAEQNAPPPLVAAPTAAAERIRALDTIRGFALLGILLLNIMAYGMHLGAYMDPTVAGGATGINLWVFLANFLLADAKMRGIFALSFGAGIVLLTSRLESRGLPAADIHYRRMLWLLLAGMIHAYFLFFGDILYQYALMGLILYPFRKMKPRGLLIFAGVVFTLLTLGFWAAAEDNKDKKEKAELAATARGRGYALTSDQEETIRGWNDQLDQMKPSPLELRRTNEAMTGGFVSALKYRAEYVFKFHSMPLYFPFHWDSLFMMLIGMAFLKLRVLSADRSYRLYAWMAGVGYAIGIPLTVWMESRFLATGFDFIEFGFAMIPYEPARVAICFGHLAVLMMLIKAGSLRWLLDLLVAVGRMAFSNYVLHSVVCAVLFSGLGWFGQLERYQLYYVVAAIWLVNLAWSPLWLKYFRFGPLEWLWRSLNYWNRQPMRSKA